MEISEARVGHTHSRRFLADKALIVDSLLVVRLLPVPLAANISTLN